MTPEQEALRDRIADEIANFWDLPEGADHEEAAARIVSIPGLRVVGNDEAVILDALRDPEQHARLGVVGSVNVKFKRGRRVVLIHMPPKDAS